MCAHRILKVVGSLCPNWPIDGLWSAMTAAEAMLWVVGSMDEVLCESCAVSE